MSINRAGPPKIGGVGVGVGSLVGPQGLQGVPGGLLIPEEIHDDPLLIPGPPGAQGNIGLQGPPSLPGMYYEPDAPDDPIMIPGAQGPQGNPGTVSLPNGTVFPLSPSPNDVFFRTDLGLVFFYNSARWLCVCPHYIVAAIQAATVPFSTSNGVYGPAPFLATNVYMTTIYFQTRVNGTSNASNYWTIANVSLGGSHAFDTHLDTASTVTPHSLVLNSVVAPGSTSGWIQINYSKTGSPGTLDLESVLEFRYTN